VGGGYRTEIYIHEARMSGATIHNPCVNKSDVDANVCGGDVYLGLSILKGLSGGLITSIITERECSGEYASLEDFIERINIGIESVQTLIFIGAFRFTGKPKSELIVRARQLLVNYKPENKTPLLIQAVKKAYKLPILQRSVLEDAFDEIELLSFPVSCSPFDLLQTKYRGDVLAKDLLQYVNREVRMLAYLVSTKQVPTKKGMMYFGTWIDVAGNYFDTAHFPKSLQQYKFQGGGCYLLLGTVMVDYHFPTITIKKMAKMPFIPDPRYEGQENNLRFIEKSGKTKAIPTDYPTRRNMKLVCRGGRWGNKNHRRPKFAQVLPCHHLTIYNHLLGPCHRGQSK
jgi:DNA polymerase III alpha subunit